MASLHFYTSRLLQESELLAALTTDIQISRVIFQDLASHPGPVADDAAVLELQVRGGHFKFDYQLFWPGQPNLTLREGVTLLQKIAQKCSIDILIDHEGLDPYNFIHIEQDGMTSTIGAEPEPYDTRDELNIEGIYNMSLGGFASQEELVAAEEKTLVDLLSEFAPAVDIVKIPYEFVNHDFKAGQERYQQLAPFVHHYFLMPVGKCAWYSREEKSGLVTRVLTTFHVKTGRDLCLFLADSVTVENIPGGSDHEAFCVLINKKGVERLVFKKRRASW